MCCAASKRIPANVAGGGRYQHGPVTAGRRSCCWCKPKRANWPWSIRHPKTFVELGRIHGAVTAKTWNNPAISGRRLLVRNHEEAVCYELPWRTKQRAMSQVLGAIPPADRPLVGFGLHRRQSNAIRCGWLLSHFLASSQSSTTTWATNGVADRRCRRRLPWPATGRRTMPITARRPSCFSTTSD